MGMGWGWTGLSSWSRTRFCFELEKKQSFVGWIKGKDPRAFSKLLPFYFLVCEGMAIAIIIIIITIIVGVCVWCVLEGLREAGPGH